jgi:E3 ubiquitin-protein ligase SHPRH
LVTTSTKLRELEEQKQKDAENESNTAALVNFQDNSSELERIKIKGECNSAKVEGVVKCLIKILNQDKAAKCIIFSEHTIVLELIIKMLKDNYISYQYINDVETCKKSIQEFKTGPSNVLLMPYSFGANGLNVTEATHVLLVEPTLNRAQEAQAIGMYP